MNELKQDIKFGVRVWRRSPGFALVAILTLSLGIGATTAIFSVVNRILLAPLPYPASDRIVNIWEVTPKGEDHNPVSSANYLDWSSARSFSAITAVVSSSAMTLTGDGDAQHVMVATMTPTATTVFGLKPLLGRAFNATDDQAAGDAVLLSEAAWRARYGADHGVVGRTVVLNGRKHTIVGVLPASFEFPDARTEFWQSVPHSAFNGTERRSHNYQVIGRLADGVTIAAAQAEMSALAHTIAEIYPEAMKGWDVLVVGLQADLTRSIRPLLLVISITVALVLLIACGNLVNLLLARAVTRQREMALRGALGAGRNRLVRQLLTESVVLAAAGGIGATITAALLLRILVAIAPAGVPMLGQVRLDSTVLAFAVGLTLFCTVLFGLAPALWLSRADLNGLLRNARGGSSSVGPARARALLLVAEIALSVVLLSGAALLGRSFQNLQQIDLGFDTHQLALAPVDLPMSGYPTIEQQDHYYQQLLDRIAAMPEVAAVGGSTHAPATGSNMTFSFAIEGRTASNASGREDPEQLHVVTSHYLDALGLAIVKGRGFTATDRAGSTPVVLINEALARKHWPNGDAVGHRINFRPGQQPWMEIVGIVRDARFDSPDADPEPALFQPYAQRQQPWITWMGIAVRMKRDVRAHALLPRIRAAARDIDARVAVDAFDDIPTLYARTIATRTFALELVGAFAALALGLSVIGLYGLMSYIVEQQRQDIGVRIALGADRTNVLGSVFMASLRLCAAGIAIGVPLALVGLKSLAALLFRVGASDPLTLAGSAGTIMLITILSTSIPAFRAAATDPMRALRDG